MELIKLIQWVLIAGGLWVLLFDRKGGWLLPLLCIAFGIVLEIIF